MNARRIGKVLRVGGITLAIILMLAQFVPVNRGNPAVGAEIDASPEVRAVLRRACYDCHSNETVWPAYSFVAPISWLVARDVHEGREAVNYSTWGAYPPERQAELLEESWEEVAEGEMPMKPYLLLHPGAALSDADRALLRDWAGGRD